MTYLVITGKANVGHRIVALINPVYAKKANAVTASVSEHQPSSWDELYLEIHYSLLLAPLGVLTLMGHLPRSNQALFGLLYCLVSLYFASVMVRLKMVSGPGCCVLAGIGVSYLLTHSATSIRHAISRLAAYLRPSTVTAAKATTTAARRLPVEIAVVAIVAVAWLLARAVMFGSRQSATKLSEPQVVQSWTFEGQRYYLDDMRQAYAWLRDNTDPDDVVLSWWDHGYQLAGMANRTTIVDNNTWNHTHIGKIGMVTFDD